MPPSCHAGKAERTGSVPPQAEATRPGSHGRRGWRRPPQGSTILVFEAALGLAVVAHGGLQPAELRAHAGLGLAIALALVLKLDALGHVPGGGDRTIGGGRQLDRYLAGQRRPRRLARWRARLAGLAPTARLAIGHRRRLEQRRIDAF